MPARREFPRPIRAAALARSGGHCEGCTAPLRPGRFAYDHVIPDGLTGEPTLTNCQVLCDACHDAKSRRQDVPAIAKAKRREAKHYAGRRDEPGRLQSRGFPKRPKPRWLTGSELARLGETP